MGMLLLGVVLTLGAFGVLWKQGLVHFGRKTGFAPVEIHNHFNTNGSAPRVDEQPTTTGSGPSPWK